MTVATQVGRKKKRRKAATIVMNKYIECINNVRILI